MLKAKREGSTGLEDGEACLPGQTLGPVPTSLVQTPGPSTEMLTL